MLIKLVDRSKGLNTTFRAYYKPNNKYLGDIYKEVDGFYAFEPHRVGQGCWTSEVLREIADKLQALNASWAEILNEELKK